MHISTIVHFCIRDEMKLDLVFFQTFCIFMFFALKISTIYTYRTPFLIIVGISFYKTECKGIKISLRTYCCYMRKHMVTEKIIRPHLVKLEESSFSIFRLFPSKTSIKS